MTTKDEALKLALEALEYISSHYMSLPKIGCMALAAIEEVLAAQKTCLVANESCKHGSWCSEVYCQEHCKFVEQPAQQPVSVTDELVDAYCWAWAQSFVTNNPYHTVKMTTEDRKHIAAGLRAALAVRQERKFAMNKKDEALKLALEALEWNLPVVEDWGGKDNLSLQHKAITAIREALAEQCVCGEPDTPGTHRTDGPCLAEQPAQQQEPVAWMWRCKPYCDWPEWSVSLKRPVDSGRDGHKRTEGYEDVPLYTSPPPRKPLSDEEIMNLCAAEWASHPIEVARAIEAKLREKNK